MLIQLLYLDLVLLILSVKARNTKVSYKSCLPCHKTTSISVNMQIRFPLTQQNWKKHTDPALVVFLP